MVKLKKVALCLWLTVQQQLSLSLNLIISEGSRSVYIEIR